jgi:hypothetical protein
MNNRMDTIYKLNNIIKDQYISEDPVSAILYMSFNIHQYGKKFNFDGQTQQNKLYVQIIKDIQAIINTPHYLNGRVYSIEYKRYNDIDHVFWTSSGYGESIKYAVLDSIISELLMKWNQEIIQNKKLFDIDCSLIERIDINFILSKPIMYMEI